MQTRVSDKCGLRNTPSGLIIYDSYAFSPSLEADTAATIRDSLGYDAKATRPGPEQLPTTATERKIADERGLAFSQTTHETPTKPRNTFALAGKVSFTMAG